MCGKSSDIKFTLEGSIVTILKRLKNMFTLFVNVPYRHWEDWRKRQKVFEERESIEPDDWLKRFGGNKKWDEDLTKEILTYIEFFGIDYRKVRPNDSFCVLCKTYYSVDTSLGDFITLVEGLLRDKGGVWELSHIPSHVQTVENFLDFANEKIKNNNKQLNHPGSKGR